MPSITTLRIKDFRNLASVDISAGPGFNIFYGDNGAGKTSLLEAINLLSSNRSFRTSKSTLLITRGSDRFTVYSELVAESGSCHKLGIQRGVNKQANIIRMDGNNVRSSSQLAKTPPLIQLDPTHFELLDGPPNGRRQLLDWLVFHVKHQYLEDWRNYQRCLKQRNILLRRGKISYQDLRYWDELLCRSAIGIERAREEVLTLFKQQLFELLTDLDEAFKRALSFEYRSGWGKGYNNLNELNQKVFESILEEHFPKDLQQGFTQYGSHKYDFTVKHDGLKAADILSRGQKKTLIMICYLAIAKIFTLMNKSSTVFLLDDLSSELDEQRLNWLCSSLKALNSQIFISAVKRESLSEIQTIKDSEDCCWFHVKHGSVDAIL